MEFLSAPEHTWLYRRVMFTLRRWRCKVFTGTVLEQCSRICNVRCCQPVSCVRTTKLTSFNELQRRLPQGKLLDVRPRGPW
jgi:hypothetical protein